MDAMGKVKSQQPSHVPKGTTVSVSGLFRSLPVRREWMQNQQRAGEELRKAEAVVKALAAVHPQLRVTFSHNKCLVWQKSAAATLRQSLLQVLGHQQVSKLEEHYVQHAQFTAVMMLPRKSLMTIAEACQSSVDCMMLYINKRPVRHKKIEKLVVRHVAEFYHKFPAWKHPACFISIELPPTELDVNVEPNKTRVFLSGEDVLLSKLDEFLNFHYEPKLLKAQVTKDHKTAVCENNQESVPNGEDKRLAKRPKLDVAQPAELPQVASQKTVRAVYRMLQEESNVTLQQCEGQGGAVDLESVPQVAGEHQQTWKDCDGLGAEPVTAATEQAAECDRGPSSSISVEAVHVQEMDSGQRRASSELFSFLDGTIEAMEVADEGTSTECGGSMAQQISGLAQDNSSNQKGPTDLSETDKCISQFFLNIDNGVKENNISELTKNENTNHFSKSISDFVQEENYVGNGAIEEAPPSCRGDNTVTECPLDVATEIVIPQDFEDTMRKVVDRGMWSNSVGSAVDNSSLGDTPVTHTDREVLQSSGNQVQLPVSQSLWEAADAAAGFSGHVVAEDQSSGGKCQPGKEPNGQSLWWNTNGIKAEKWSRGNVITKQGQALKSGAVLVSGGTSLDETIQSASSQMGCKEQSAFTKFSRYMRPKILDENPGMAFTKVAGLLVSRWRALPPGEQARYEDLAAHAEQQKHCEKERRLVSPANLKKCTKREVRQRNTLDNMMQRGSHPTKPSMREFISTETLPISVDDVREQISLRSAERVGDGGDQKELRLLGQLKPSGSWLYLRGQELGVLRHWGLQEKVIHYKLMSEHVVPTRPLDDKLPVFSSTLGSELWNLLLSLDRKFCPQARSVLVSSPAIHRNGFKVEVRESGDRVLCFLTSVASVTRFCGLADLRETLQLMQSHGSELAHLRYCRPLKIANYLRCEAVRISQQSPSTMDRDALLELLRFWDFHMREEEQMCLHHKAIYAPVHLLGSTGADAVRSS